MRISLNGEAAEVEPGTTVEQFITARAGSTRGSAVVVDGEVVPRSSWPQHLLAEGADVELITAVQGG